MRRDPALIPLSRFHRSVLFLALVCKENAPVVKGYPKDDEGKRSYAISFYNTQLKDHIAVEETKLFPAVAPVNDQLKALVKELSEEHKLLDRLFAELHTTAKVSETLNRLGVLLESHVRKEERQFFQLIQESLDENNLLVIGRLLTS